MKRKNRNCNSSKLLDNQFSSSSKLYQTSPKFHLFPQTERFSQNSKLINLQNLYMPSTLSKISTDQGKGKKYMYPQFHYPNAQLVPAADAYDIKREFDRRTQSGKTFGIPHNSYYNTYQPYSLGRTVKYDSSYTPGPGQYEIKTARFTDDDKKRFTMPEKPKEIDLNFFKVPPNAYKPKFSQTEKEIVKKYTFGYGRKLKITEITPQIKEQYNPGPGSYEVDTAFKNKSKNFKMNPVLQSRK